MKRPARKTQLSTATLTKSQEDEQRLHTLAMLVMQLDEDSAFSRHQLLLILNSSRWKLANRLFAISEKLHFQQMLGFVRPMLRRIRPPSSPGEQIKAQLPPKREIPIIHNLSPYKNLQLLKDIPITVVEEDFPIDYFRPPFSIATPVWNEEAGIVDFLTSIENQSQQPQEAILVDGASNDNTVPLIEQFAKHASFKISIIRQQRIPIAMSRNLAIKKAKTELIVMADAGAILDTDYCKNLLGCFKKYKADLVGGIYFPIEASEQTRSFIPEWELVDWQRFLPSTRAMALKKSLWKKMGGFPEHIFYGDDTLFDVNYRRVSQKWTYNKLAKTAWDAPVSQAQYERTSHNYGVGDGENGLGEYFYTNILTSTKSELSLHFSPVRKDFLAGYIEGRVHRSQIELMKRNIKGVMVFLTTIPFYEDQSSLVYKLIIKLIADNYKVICVHFYPNIKTLSPKVFVDTDYTLLELYYVDDFDLDELLVRYPPKAIKMEVRTDGDYLAYASVLRAMKAKKLPVSRL